MKKAIVVLFAVIFIAMLLCSCGRTEPDFGSEEDFTDPNGLPEPMSFEEVSVKYPDKTVLVWASEHILTAAIYFAAFILRLRSRYIPRSPRTSL